MREKSANRGIRENTIVCDGCGLEFELNHKATYRDCCRHEQGSFLCGVMYPAGDFVASFPAVGRKDAWARFVASSIRAEASS